MTEPLRVAFVSLGCAKNTVDSEKMLGQLAEAGCIITSDESEADAMVINTCGFLDASRLEAEGVIREAVRRKAEGTLKRLVVAGCLVQRDQKTLLDRIDGIDALVGVNNRDDVVQAVLATGRSGSGGTTDLYLSDYHPFVQIDTARLRITPRHYAYLRIGEGCDQKCTFCTIPSIRGPMHCKPPSVILDEARELVRDGSVEIILIGQDTTSYGRGETRFDVELGGLLRKLDQVEGIGWVRLMYAYPTEMTDEILDSIAQCEHVCNYIDLPLQHINDRILKGMHRRIDRAQTERLLENIRRRIPGVTIRTTMIAGFPGETDEEFDELVRFVQDFRFDALGVFPYSCEPDTPAGRMQDQRPDRLKRERVDVLMGAQQAVAFSGAEERIGTEFKVLVDDSGTSDGTAARHQGQAPEVDSVTFLEGPASLTEPRHTPGAFLTVRCIGRRDYDLVAAPLAIPSPEGRSPTHVSLPVLAP